MGLRKAYKMIFKDVSEILELRLEILPTVIKEVDLAKQEKFSEDTCETKSESLLE